MTQLLEHPGICDAALAEIIEPVSGLCDEATVVRGVKVVCDRVAGHGGDHAGIRDGERVYW